MQTIGETIRSHASVRPDAPAIVSMDRKPLSYAQLQQQIEEIGVQLRRGGFSCDARIGVALLHGPEAVLVIVAVACHATVVPVNNSLTAGELRQLFQRARLDAILLTQATAPHIRKVASDLGLAIIEAVPGKGAEIECALSMPARAAAGGPEPGPDSLALVLQTSGTTGLPKLVPITHKNLQSEAVKIRDWFKLTPDDRCLAFLPLHYAHGLRETLFPPIITGGSVARPANHSQFNIVEWLGTLEPTWYSAFPIHHHSIFELISANTGAPPLHCLRFILSSGTPLKPELQQRLAGVLAAPVLEFYGIGEAGHMSANLPPPGKCRAGTCGMPLPGEMMIAQDGRALPPCELGELLVRGPTVISGYLDNSQANEESFVDGWFRTGDLGAFDADGFLSIHGRFKELINRGGEKLSPIEVEQALLRHPAVADAAACGIPHPRLGEDVAAAIVLRPSRTAAPSELQSFVRGQLASFKVPRLVTIVPELPKDVTGKVRRRELAAALAGDATASSSSNLEDPCCPLTADLMQLWRNFLQCDSIGLDDDFFAKGGDSLLAVRMRLAVEQRTGLVLPDAIPFEAPTIRRFAQAVRECSRPTPLLTVQPGGKGLPFFFFHGDFLSGGFYVRRLAEFLGSTTTLISVAPHGLGSEPAPRSVQQMALDRLPLILAAQPVGPFRLGGHCNGGTVAFEVARLLQAAGHRVELLALIDVPLLNAGSAMRLLRRALAGALCFLVRDVAKREALMAACLELMWLLYEKPRRFWQMKPAKRRAKTVEKLKACIESLRRWIVGRLPAFSRSRPPDPGSMDPLLRREPMQRRRHYFRALASYFPEPLEIPIVYYSAEHSGHYLKGISSQLEIIKLRSDHFGCITTHMHMTADHLRNRLSCRSVSAPPQAADSSASVENAFVG